MGTTKQIGDHTPAMVNGHSVSELVLGKLPIVHAFEQYDILCAFIGLCLHNDQLVLPGTTKSHDWQTLRTWLPFDNYYQVYLSFVHPQNSRWRRTSNQRHKMNRLGYFSHCFDLHGYKRKWCMWIFKILNRLVGTHTSFLVQPNTFVCSTWTSHENSDKWNQSTLDCVFRDQKLYS